MRRPLAALSLCLFSRLAFAQDSQPADQPAATQPTTEATSIPVEAPSVQSLPSEITVPPPNMSFRREIRNTSGMSFNLIGLQNSVDLSWSKKLYKSTSSLMDGAHIAVGLNNSTSPAYTRVAAWVEFSPLSILDFRFGAEPSVYFGTFSTLINFETYDSDYSVAGVAAIDEQSAPGFAGRLYFEPTFKVAAGLGPGRLIAAAYADFEFWKLFNTEVASQFFYESQRDTLVQSSGDFVVPGANVLLYEYKINEAAGRVLLAGLSHDYIVIPGDDNNNTRQTLGLLTVLNLSKRMGDLYKPTVIAKVFNYLQDREDLGKLNEFGAQVAFRFYVGPPR
jgi:hypothetical protein